MKTSFDNIGNIEGAYESFFGAELKSNTCYYDPLGTSAENNLVNTDRKLAEVKSKISDTSKFVYDARAELNYNYNKKKAQLKALTSTTGGSGTTDNVLQPIALDPEMWDLSRKELPARTLFRRVSNIGAKAVWNTLDSKQGGEFYSELQPNNYNDISPSRHSTDIKMLRSTGVTSYFADATQPGYDINGFNYQANADGTVGTYTS